MKAKAARRAKRKHRRLTDAEIVEAIASGRFAADAAGTVYAVNGRRKPIATYRDHKGRDCLYLYYRGGRRNTTVGRAVWMCVNGREVPDGHDVDHVDGDRTNHQPDNLQLLESTDNRRKGRGQLSLDEEFGEF